MQLICTFGKLLVFVLDMHRFKNEDLFIELWLQSDEDEDEHLLVDRNFHFLKKQKGQKGKKLRSYQ